MLKHFSCVRLLRPHGLEPARPLCSWNSPGKNTGVGCHFLYQWIFLTLGSSPCLMSPALAPGLFSTWEAQNYHMTQQFHSWYIWKKKNSQSTNSETHMHRYINSSIIYSCQEMEATYMSINRWMNKEDVAHIYTMKYQPTNKRMKFCHL